MMDAPQGARGAKSNRALCRNVEAQRRRKTPDCPVVLDLVACVTPLPLAHVCLPPGAWFPGLGRGALAACEVCLSAEAGVFSGHPSQSAGKRGQPQAPTPAASRTETLGFFFFFFPPPIFYF